MGMKIIKSGPVDKGLKKLKEKKERLSQSIGTDEQKQKKISEENNVLAKSNMRLDERNKDLLFLIERQEEYTKDAGKKAKVAKKECDILDSKKSMLEKQIISTEKTLDKVRISVSKKTDQVLEGFDEAEAKKIKRLNELSLSIEGKEGEEAILSEKVGILNNQLVSTTNSINTKSLQLKDLLSVLGKKMKRLEDLDKMINRLVESQNESMRKTDNFSGEIELMLGTIESLEKEVAVLDGRKKRINSDIDKMDNEKFILSNIGETLRKKQQAVEEAFKKANVKLPSALKNIDKVK